MATVIALRPLGRGGFLEIWSLITAARFLEVEVFAYAVNYVSNFSTFVNAIGLAKSGVDREILAYSINPLPSALLEQPRYFEEVVKIRSYVPLPGLAQVLAQFRYGSCLLFFAFGVCAGGLRGLLSIVGAGMPGVYFWACVLIPLVFALQYNLRTASRLGYAVAFLGVVFIVLRFISGRRSALAAEVQR
jgi:hypothetical protein